MIDNALNAAGSRLTTGIAALKQALGADRETAQMVEQTVTQAKVAMPLPVQPNLPDFTTVSFDRSAPRGTYLNIIV